MKLQRFTPVVVLSLVLWAPVAGADDQPPYECDDQFGACGTPEQSGGGGGGGGSVLVNNTDLGDTYQYADDYDDDGIEDPYDNCPFVRNPEQADDDGDTIGTACDNCPAARNEDQLDSDGDRAGDACDDDSDGDGVDNGDDNCPHAPNPPDPDTGQQANTDGLGDGGDACDDDIDEDGIANLEDNCPLVYNPDQADSAPGSFGDACDDDDDGDGVRNTFDNCPAAANETQDDTDQDAIGDACDPDDDGDGVMDGTDNCPLDPNEDQLDEDRDGIGETCDPRFCYVVMGDSEHCLDPTDTFYVYTPPRTTSTGEPVRLRLFANRRSEPLRYTWRIESAPAQSDATIANPIGEASVSTPFEYHYPAETPASLTPDRPGHYVVSVTAELAGEDPVTKTAGVRAQMKTTVVVTEEPLNEGCAAASGSVWPAFSALGLLLGCRRRPRRRT